MIGFTTMTRELNGQRWCWCVSWLISLSWRQLCHIMLFKGEKLDATEVAGSHVHLIPEEPCAAMTFTNERNISLFAPPPHNHRTMISSLEGRAEVSVYWPLLPILQLSAKLSNIMCELQPCLLSKNGSSLL